MTEKVAGYFNDDGSEFNPHLRRVSALRATCRKNGDPKEETACNLTRHDQAEADRFLCFAYENIR